MITVSAIHIAPVKSLGLLHPNTVRVGTEGIVEDRRFYLIDAAERLVTQREVFSLVQVKAEYAAEPERLSLRFPDGSEVSDSVNLGENVSTVFWGRTVTGQVVTGPFNQALSNFGGGGLRLVRSDAPGQCQDEYPISIMSEASVQMLAEQPGAQGPPDSRRFRPTFLLSGGSAHQEDEWLGSSVQIGEELRLRLVARDPRCAITTHDPTTGSPDMDTLRLILAYRPADRAYFGVYGLVERPGAVSLGAAVRQLE